MAQCKSQIHVSDHLRIHRRSSATVLPSHSSLLVIWSQLVNIPKPMRAPEGQLVDIPQPNASPQHPVDNHPGIHYKPENPVFIHPVSPCPRITSGASRDPGQSPLFTSQPSCACVRACEYKRACVRACVSVAFRVPTLRGLAHFLSWHPLSGEERKPPPPEKVASCFEDKGAPPKKKHL